MEETAKEISVQTADGRVVARMNLRNGVLHGLCEWFDGCGNRVARGTFADGVPVTGTFLDWNRFFPGSCGQDPFAPETYGQDWVTKFEASFLSQSPDYGLVSERYRDGQRIAPAP